MIVHFTPRARNDLAGIRSWIAKDDPARALSFVRELRQRALALCDYPHRHPVAHMATSGPVHKLTHGRYLLYYRVLPEKVEILHVRHGAMNTSTFD